MSPDSTTPFDVSLAVARSEQQDDGGWLALSGQQPASQLKPVRLWHRRIDQGDPEGASVDGRLLALARDEPRVFDDRRREAEIGQALGKTLAGDRVIVNDQDRQACPIVRGYCRFPRAVGATSPQWNRKMEAAALAGYAFDFDLAGHHLDKTKRNRQAEACAAEPARCRAVSLLERLKDRS